MRATVLMTTRLVRKRGKVEEVLFEEPSFSFGAELGPQDERPSQSSHDAFVEASLRRRFSLGTPDRRALVVEVATRTRLPPSKSGADAVVDEAWTRIDELIGAERTRLDWEAIG